MYNVTYASGYLACSLLLQDTDEESLLLVNTLVKDLASRNVLEVNMALTAMAHLAPPETTAMTAPLLLEKTAHTKDFVRKKALVCLQRVLESDAGAPSPELESRVLSCLSDPDPGVVAVAVQVGMKRLKILLAVCFR